MRALCKPSGLHPARWQRRSMREELGGVGAGRSPALSLPPTPPVAPHEHFRGGGTPAFSTRRPGPSLETRGAPSRGRELTATCSPALPLLPESAARAAMLQAVRCACAGVQGGCVTFPRTPSQLGGWRRPRGLPAGDRSPAQPTQVLAAQTPPSRLCFPSLAGF